jgi:DNA-binding NarL/FixJ family response regulator
MATARVLLVDDDSFVRLGLMQLLTQYSGLEVVGEAATGDEAIASVDRLRPDVVVMDIRMPRMDGIAATREIKRKYPEVQILGLSEYAYGYHLDAMEKAGAVGTIQKSQAPEELYAALKKIIGWQTL